MSDELISKKIDQWKSEIDMAWRIANSFHVAIFSPNRKLIYANEGMQKLLKGEPSESFINPTFDKLLTFDHKEPLIFEGILTLGDRILASNSINVKIFRKNDEILILGTIDGLKLNDQNKTLHNLNQQINRLQHELIKEKNILGKTLSHFNSANNNLLRLNADKDRFISILAHDLKNPFLSILGLSELLYKELNNDDNPDIKDVSKLLFESSQNTVKLLEDLLEWARAESGKLPFKLQKIDLKAVGNQISDIYSSNAVTKKIQLKNTISEDTFILADENMIKTVLRNLISNAIKFTQNEGEVILSSRELPNETVISVTDNGVGMSEKVKSELFDVSNINTKLGTAGEKGSGFGLLLCKEFVEKHRGKIWIESEIGKGSTFNFSIPKDLS